MAFIADKFVYQKRLSCKTRLYAQFRYLLSKSKK